MPSPLAAAGASSRVLCIQRSDIHAKICRQWWCVSLKKSTNVIWSQTGDALLGQCSDLLWHVWQTKLVDKDVGDLSDFLR